MSTKPSIFLADHAGFCFGVEAAVSKIEEVLKTHDNVYALGEVVHNDFVNDGLREQGLTIVDEVSDVPDDALVVLRTHGVPKRVYEYFEERCIAYEDVTCPFVKRTHRIVSKLDPETDLLFVAGEPTHAEVIGILGHAACETYVFSSCEQLEELLEAHKETLERKKLTVVSQTTFRLSEWNSCIKKLNLNYTTATVFDTICKATEERQNEAEVLSKHCDRMVVVGSKHSSNTRKLFDVCNRNCVTCLVESKKDLDPEFLGGANTIGVTAGASTPSAIIKEVLEAMSEVENKIVNEEVENEDFAAMLEESLGEMSNDQRVKGTVVGVTPTEIQVAIDGRKQTGFIKFEEYSYDPNVNPAEEVKVGDEINCVIMKTNDVEGTIMLSKRRFDSANAWEELEEAVDAETILEGNVTDINKGGVIATTEKGIRVFIPGSLATESRGEPLDNLLKSHVRFKIIEVNKQRKRAVGSIKAVLKEERKAAKEKFWETAEVGQTFTGVVKSLTSYGAFVDIGGVDGMIHISELSWKRIKHPSEVVNVGDTVEVNIKSLEDGRISLGYKKSEDNPWVVLQNTYNVGD
ncbi:MAG: 4-hydroxy-3-methylbut-2-enyl diphosphate reductase, partial [Clostridia bacterium]|nr:4-hydroxy-3-methylbut-2-enyl diphosphate reductase [Clostridia bacterium]